MRLGSIGALAALAGLSSIREVKEGYGHSAGGGMGAGWERARRSPEVSAMKIAAAQTKRERKAAKKICEANYY